MRVLFVTHAFPRWSGDIAGAFVHRLASALTDEGAEVRVLAPSAPSLERSESIAGIPVTRFRYAPRAWETLAYTGTMAEQVGGSLRSKVALLGMLAGAARAVRDQCRGFAPHIVHAHWWFPAALAATWSVGTTPLVTTMHGSDVRLASGSGVGRAALRRVGRRSAVLTTVSEWLARSVRAIVPDATVHVAPMPADTDLFVPADTSRSGRFLFVGRLNRQKGIALLLEALSRTRPDTELDVVGAGPDQTALAALVAELRLGGRVHFRGMLSQSELLPLYQSATALVIPSEDEGLGLVAVEAQLCETPVIAFRSGGLVDLVADGETGLLTPPGDVSALAGAMTRVLDDPGRGRSWGRTGRASVLQSFAPQRVARRYLELYGQVIRDE